MYVYIYIYICIYIYIYTYIYTYQDEANALQAAERSLVERKLGETQEFRPEFFQILESKVAFKQNVDPFRVSEGRFKTKPAIWIVSKEC